MKASTLIRLLLTVCLLWQVYTHAHWSVGVCLTLLVLGREMDGWIVGKIVQGFVKAKQEEDAEIKAMIERIRNGNKANQSN